FSVFISILIFDLQIYKLFPNSPTLHRFSFLSSSATPLPHCSLLTAHYSLRCTATPLHRYIYSYRMSTILQEEISFVAYYHIPIMGICLMTRKQ
ncbi:hypothetical protein, partial [uncultured Prevotella sp.]|uniref:hypothetical protein n=1 Tax=uncultured Prevotella sp. TaxID=159272 RepID=UPI0025971D6F